MKEGARNALVKGWGVFQMNVQTDMGIVKQTLIATCAEEVLPVKHFELSRGEGARKLQGWKRF